MTTDKEKVLRAAEIVETNWTQGSNARDAKGNRVLWDDPTAVSFCMLGAMHKASFGPFGNDQDSPIFKQLQLFVRRRHGTPFPWQFNDRDGTTAEMVATELRDFAETLP